MTGITKITFLLRLRRRIQVFPIEWMRWFISDFKPYKFEYVEIAGVGDESKDVEHLKELSRRLRSQISILFTMKMIFQVLQDKAYKDIRLRRYHRSERD